MENFSLTSKNKSSASFPTIKVKKDGAVLFIIYPTVHSVEIQATHYYIFSGRTIDDIKTKPHALSEFLRAYKDRYSRGDNFEICVIKDADDVSYDTPSNFVTRLNLGMNSFMLRTKVDVVALDLSLQCSGWQDSWFEHLPSNAYIYVIQNSQPTKYSIPTYLQLFFTQAKPADSDSELKFNTNATGIHVVTGRITAKKNDFRYIRFLFSLREFPHFDHADITYEFTLELNTNFGLISGAVRLRDSSAQKYTFFMTACSLEHFGLGSRISSMDFSSLHSDHLGLKTFTSNNAHFDRLTRGAAAANFRTDTPQEMSHGYVVDWLNDLPDTSPGSTDGSHQNSDDDHTIQNYDPDTDSANNQFGNGPQYRQPGFSGTQGMHQTKIRKNCNFIQVEGDLTVNFFSDGYNNGSSSQNNFNDSSTSDTEHSASSESSSNDNVMRKPEARYSRPPPTPMLDNTIRAGVKQIPTFQSGDKHNPIYSKTSFTGIDQIEDDNINSGPSTSHSYRQQHEIRSQPMQRYPSATTLTSCNLSGSTMSESYRDEHEAIQSQGVISGESELGNLNNGMSTVSQLNGQSSKHVPKTFNDDANKISKSEDAKSMWSAWKYVKSKLWSRPVKENRTKPDSLNE